MATATSLDNKCCGRASRLLQGGVEADLAEPSSELDAGQGPSWAAHGDGVIILVHA
jgi:hypothetical protein